ncbi:MAG: substrate-binding domain-containing protein [Verrucomicrobiota bacterium]
MTNQKKKTVKISFDQRERSVAVIRALVRSGFFQNELPTEMNLSRVMHMPRTYISHAITQLVAEGLLKSTTGSNWHIDYDDQYQNSVAFIINTNPLHGWQSVFLDFFIGFEEILFQEGYRALMIGNFVSTKEKQEKIASLRANGCMGFALVSRSEKKILSFMEEEAVPCVLLGNATLNEEGFGCVCTDNDAGMTKTIDYLVEKGHRRIAYYSTGLGFHDGIKVRLNSYLRNMRRYHLPPISEICYPEPHHKLSAERAVETLSHMTLKPTAIICGNDREAFELVSILKYKGVRIPADVSIVGLGNNYYGQLLDPPVTTLDIHAVNMGQIAAHYLLNEMMAPQLPVKIMIPTEMIERNSVTSIPTQENPVPSDSTPESDPSGILTF